MVNSTVPQTPRTPRTPTGYHTGEPLGYTNQDMRFDAIEGVVPINKRHKEDFTCGIIHWVMKHSVTGVEANQDFSIGEPLLHRKHRLAREPCRRSTSNAMQYCYQCRAIWSDN
ncbi:hypothetical protein QYM36_010011 [Artemia franciscana]|uniref:Uncharacterized protein n=1 Tax=Artemia franciscana TaxID=6661 RepID=A0AA88L193_ARTSF|nr:hypothetical protein QYM36_010011 [Artemia franciscana]